MRVVMETRILGFCPCVRACVRVHVSLYMDVKHTVCVCVCTYAGDFVFPRESEGRWKGPKETEGER